MTFSDMQIGQVCHGSYNGIPGIFECCQYHKQHFKAGEKYLRTFDGAHYKLCERFTDIAPVLSREAAEALTIENQRLRSRVIELESYVGDVRAALAQVRKSKSPATPTPTADKPSVAAIENTTPHVLVDGVKHQDDSAD